jgi:hypothetical protein
MNDSLQITDEMRLEVLAEAVMKSHANLGWKRALTLADIPEEIGHYAIYDGIEVRGAGVVKNMRTGAESATFYRSLKFPILLFLPDRDGSAALWLDGLIRCPRCDGQVHDIFLHDHEDGEE